MKKNESCCSGIVVKRYETGPKIYTHSPASTQWAMVPNLIRLLITDE